MQIGFFFLIVTFTSTLNVLKDETRYL